MTYGQIKDVKARLHRADSDTSLDTDIQLRLNQVDALIDLELTGLVTTPLIGNVSNVIVDVANDWTAGLIQQEIINPTAKTDDQSENIFVKRAKENLARYIELAFRETDAGSIYEKPVDVD